ncbi:MAG: hypothetical protein J6K20_12770 [Thermoguttaceae bacterium]|nr:hypothetical protein [Thermoguttaceae bacterium]
MKRSISLWTACALVGFAALGCQEKPEIAFEEYGETTATLPFVENLPDDFPLPEEADPPTCVMREQAINGAKFDRELIKKAAEKKTDATDSQAK